MRSKIKYLSVLLIISLVITILPLSVFAISSAQKKPVYITDEEAFTFNENEGSLAGYYIYGLAENAADTYELTSDDINYPIYAANVSLSLDPQVKLNSIENIQLIDGASLLLDTLLISSNKISDLDFEFWSSFCEETLENKWDTSDIEIIFDLINYVYENIGNPLTYTAKGSLSLGGYFGESLYDVSVPEGSTWTVPDEDKLHVLHSLNVEGSLVGTNEMSFLELDNPGKGPDSILEGSGLTLYADMGGQDLTQITSGNWNSIKDELNPDGPILFNWVDSKWQFYSPSEPMPGENEFKLRWDDYIPEDGSEAFVQYSINGIQKQNANNGEIVSFEGSSSLIIYYTPAKEPNGTPDLFWGLIEDRMREGDYHPNAIEAGTLSKEGETYSYEIEISDNAPILIDFLRNAPEANPLDLVIDSDYGSLLGEYDSVTITESGSASIDANESISVRNRLHVTGTLTASEGALLVFAKKPDGSSTEINGLDLYINGETEPILIENWNQFVEENVATPTENETWFDFEFINDKWIYRDFNQPVPGDKQFMISWDDYVPESGTPAIASYQIGSNGTIQPAINGSIVDIPDNENLYVYYIPALDSNNVPVEFWGFFVDNPIGEDYEPEYISKDSGKVTFFNEVYKYTHERNQNDKPLNIVILRNDPNEPSHEEPLQPKVTLNMTNAVGGRVEFGTDPRFITNNGIYDGRDFDLNSDDNIFVKLETCQGWELQEIKLYEKNNPNNEIILNLDNDIYTNASSFENKEYILYIEYTRDTSVQAPATTELIFEGDCVNQLLSENPEQKELYIKYKTSPEGSYSNIYFSDLILVPSEDQNQPIRYSWTCPSGAETIWLEADWDDYYEVSIHEAGSAALMKNTPLEIPCGQYVMQVSKSYISVTWSYDPSAFGQDGYIDHGILESLSVYRDDSWVELYNIEDYPIDPTVDPMYQGFEISPYCIVYPNEQIRVVLVPEYGYQIKSASICNVELEAEDNNISSFVFTIERNVHFASVFVPSEDIIDVSASNVVTDASIADGINATETGNLSLAISDVDASTQLIESDAASDVDLIEDCCFDLDLNLVVSKGNNDYWNQDITEFEEPIEIVLNVGTEFEDGLDYYVIREHNGSFEKLQATYDKTLGTLTFSSNRFSVFQLAVEKNEESSDNSPTPTPTTTPATEVNGFIERLYTVALGREAEEGGMNTWISALSSGQETGGSIASFFCTCEEMVNRNLSNDEYVTMLYHLFFNRAPDRVGFANWKDKLDNGDSRESILQGFIDSVEWANVCFIYDINSGGTAIHNLAPSQEITDFLVRFYSIALGRPIDDNGLDDWGRALVNKRMTASEVAYGIIFSEEFKGFDLSNDDYIERLYQTFMNRASDEVGRRYWLNRLEEGATREDVFYGFAGSEEFKRICDSYGINN